MSAVDFYSATAARRSLLHFAAGRLVAAAVGFAYLVTTVRAMQVADYGLYVAVLAGCEIFYVVSGLGLSTLAQRYVADYRVHSTTHDFAAFLARALRRRLVLSLAFATGIGVLWLPLTALTGVLVGVESRWLILLLFIATAGGAFLDEVMGALLLQGYTQALGASRGICKLALVAGALLAGLSVSIETVLYIEAAVAVASWLAAEFIVRRWARVVPAAPHARPGYSVLDMSNVSFRFYLVQLTGQSYGPSMVKLLVTRLLGASQTAALGLAQSVTDMLRNYMPAHLLGSWIRPIMISRYVARRDVSELSAIANVVFKLNLLGILPVAAVFVVAGDPLIAALSAGRYPQLGGLLTILSALIVLQSAHLLLSMITLTLEQPNISLRATLAAAATLPLLVLAMLTMGLKGAALGLVLAEATWVSISWHLLHRRGFRLKFDLIGAFEIACAAATGGLVGALCVLPHVALPWWAAASLVALAYAGMLFIFRPASPDDLALIRQLLSKPKGRPVAS